MGRAAKEQINRETKKELRYPYSSYKTMIPTHHSISRTDSHRINPRAKTNILIYIHQNLEQKERYNLQP